jgi:hypothetical protein
MSGATTRALPLAVGVCALAVACGSSDPSASPSPTSSSSLPEITCGSLDEIPFASQLVVPADPPKGLRLGNACSSESSQSQTAYLFYSSEDGQGRLLIEILSGSRAQELRLEGQPTIQLGDLVGQVSDESQPGGDAFYSIQFEKDERLYTVAVADVGVNNPVTPEDIDAVALSIAEN